MIRIEDVRFRWHRREPLVLDIPALEIEGGERVFIRGPSGSGKTTLLNLLGGVVTPESGHVFISDTDVARLSGPERDAFRADNVGFIFQLFNLVPYLSMVENVALPCRFSAVRRARTLENAGSVNAAARGLLEYMDLDVDTLASRQVSRLSVGQQQRVAAARSLIGAPGLIIADEPTSSLDTDVRRAFLDLLFDEVGTNGATLVFVSHDPLLADAFDRVIELTAVNRAGAGNE